MPSLQSAEVTLDLESDDDVVVTRELSCDPGPKEEEREAVRSPSTPILPNCCHPESFDSSSMTLSEGSKSSKMFSRLLL